MKKLVLIALTSVAFCPVVASAQSIPIVIGSFAEDEIVVTATPTFEEQLEVAVKKACEKPFIRNLKSQLLYAECLAEARAQAAAILAERTARLGAELVLR